ncbi:hypothetical protein I4U23_010347 [Adineta vaga]|nr:hypothetical protein I4U23_010347 [Adineta vaga]
MLISFWSLNCRFNSLICSILSINNERLNSGLLISNGLSYSKHCSIIFPLILNSLPLCSSIRRIHLDDINSMACDFCYEWLFSGQNVLRFPNLKTLILTRCGTIVPVIQSLTHLIRYQ